MAKLPPQISFDWRDENYGSVCAVTAFRNYTGNHDWSALVRRRFRG